MNTEPNENQAKKQPEDGSEEDLNLTNSDATLANQTPKQADAPTMTDNATNVGTGNLTQSVMNGSEINPEYGDSADPAFEKMVTGD
jgi:hypothetical protein